MLEKIKQQILWVVRSIWNKFKSLWNRFIDWFTAGLDK
jgi:hypothetical protein